MYMCFMYMYFISQSLFLSTLEDDTTAMKTNWILKHVLTNKFAKDFNYLRQNNFKQTFEKFHLKTVVICK